MKTSTLFRTLSALLIIVVLFATVTLATNKIVTTQNLSQEDSEPVAMPTSSKASGQSENSLYFKYYKILKARAKMHKV